MLRVIAIVVLAAVWSWFVIIPYAQQMLQRRQSTQMPFATGGAAAFRGPVAPVMASRAAKKRRLVIMMALAMAALITLPLAIIFRGIFIAEHLLFDALLVGYVLLAARAGSVEMEARRKVAPIGHARPAATIPLRAVGER